MKDVRRFEPNRDVRVGVGFRRKGWTVIRDLAASARIMATTSFS